MTETNPEKEKLVELQKTYSIIENEITIIQQEIINVTNSLKEYSKYLELTNEPFYFRFD